MHQYRFALAALLAILLNLSARAADPSTPTTPVNPPLKLQKGDHICIIGNTLAERMQQDGWLETLLQARFPEHQLVIRNLGFAADELTIRQRSENFGTPDEWLSGVAKPVGGFRENRLAKAETKADVIFAFFGFNESFAGSGGLDKFRADLEKFIKDSRSKQYNGKSAPRVVLFSPIAHENLKNRDLPDGVENNQNLRLYTNAMADVAKANEVTFVDLFTPSQALYAKAEKPLTDNGVHLNDHGNKLIAFAIDKALFGAGKSDEASLEKLRQAVVDKCFYWYHRYRTTDGFSTYGTRAFLPFVNGQTNYEVLQRELQMLDVKTSNRDQRIWAVAQGKDLQVDDSNLPPPVEVITKQPGKGPKGAHVYQSGEDAIKSMKVASGMKVNLFASEEKFPELIKPVQMAWDTKGRLWVAAWPSYPHWNPRDKPNDKLLILEDTDGDGKADTCKTFADDLQNPTGFEFYNGGVIVAQAPYIMFLKDTDGDDKADVRVRLLSGMDTADTHHTSNSFTFDPGGALYWQEGTFHRTQVETPYGPARNRNACVWRFEPRTGRFERYVAFDFANPHGHVFDYWGQDIVHDGTGAEPYQGALFSGYIPFPNQHNRPPKVYSQRIRPVAGSEILTSRHFPDENQGNLLVANVIGFQGIHQYKMSDKDAGLAGTEMEPIVQSTDLNFRPADIEVGPDGAIYFTDWQNVLIGHMQYNLRDPSRDHQHGRVYRVTYEGRPLDKPAKIAGEPIEKLLDLLKDPENRVRYRTRIELSARKTGDVMAALDKWVNSLDKSDPAYEHHLTEALWLHQWHNVVDEALLKKMLRSTEPHARAAATRVLCYWRDRVKDPLALLKVQATDDNPRVRLEAIRACSFFTTPAAQETALESLNKPQDAYLKYTLEETLKTLEKTAK